MSTAFSRDEHPGAPRILFIGLAESSHTRGWIDLLAGSGLNVRLFALWSGAPDPDWPVKTYVSHAAPGRDSARRRYFYPKPLGRATAFLHRAARALHLPLPVRTASHWLADVIRTWKPDVIHTLGLFDDQGGLFYLRTRREHNLQRYGRWVLQLRGGSDLVRRFDPTTREILRDALTECGQVVSDNVANVQYIRELGVDTSKVASITPMPGSGGLDVPAEPPAPPSRRERIVVWPKAYESRWSKALPVLEAIQLAWSAIAPAEFHFLATDSEVAHWHSRLPPEIRDHCHLADRVPRQEALALLRRARVMLAPSLVDGIPNSMYEAMAYGAVPIVSPLDSICSVVNASNVLFARNMDAPEIASALERALNDDAFADGIAPGNHALVRRIADRAVLRPRLVEYYRGLAQAPRS